MVQPAQSSSAQESMSAQPSSSIEGLIPNPTTLRTKIGMTLIGRLINANQLVLALSCTNDLSPSPNQNKLSKLIASKLIQKGYTKKTLAQRFSVILQGKTEHPPISYGKDKKRTEEFFSQFLKDYPSKVAASDQERLLSEEEGTRFCSIFFPLPLFYKGCPAEKELETLRKQCEEVL